MGDAGGAAAAGLERLRRACEMPVPVAVLWDWHQRPEAFAELVPPWEEARILGEIPPIETGREVTIRTGRFPFRMLWVARYREVDPGREFVDEQIRGPFAYWLHRHRMTPIDAHRSLLEDLVEYRLPLGSLGRAVAGAFVRGRLEKRFTFRHEATLASLRRGI